MANKPKHESIPIMRAAESLGINLTPTLYINGQPVDPKDKNPEGVRAAINAVLAGKPHA